MQITKKTYKQRGNNAVSYQTMGVSSKITPLLFNKTLIDHDGNTYGNISVLFTNNNIEYRGQLLICSCDTKVGNFIEGTAELYDIMRVKDINGAEWKDNILLPKDRTLADNFTFVWFLRNPVKCVEVPCSIQYGYQRTYWTDADDILPYPEYLSARNIDMLIKNPKIKQDKLWEFQLNMKKKLLILFLRTWLKVNNLRKLAQKLVCRQQQSEGGE